MAVPALAAVSITSAQEAPPSAPAAAPPSSWVRAPQPDFPAQATAAGISDGRVVLECRVSAEGTISGCVVLEETPLGAGFREAALAALREARAAPRTRNGRPVSGRARFLIPFQQPTPASPVPPTA